MRDFLVFLLRRIYEDNCPQNAATLTYTTLLSMVPLLAIGFSVLAAFPVFEPFRDKIQQIVLNNLVPASGEAAVDQLQKFIDKAGGLTAVGLVGLIISALLMMGAIDRALNDIWRVHKRRRPIQGFMIYWTVLTSTPLLIGASLAVSSYLVTLGEQHGLTTPSSGQRLLVITPYLGEWLAFIFLYAAVPNKRVPLKHAVLGAAVGAILFEIAKAGFAFYVEIVPTYDAIYGALAAIPLFLIWLWLSWTVVLIGAEFTQALSAFRELPPERWVQPRRHLLHAVTLLRALWGAQRQGKPLSRTGMARSLGDYGDALLTLILPGLQQRGWVAETADGQWVVLRDLNETTLAELFLDGEYVLPTEAVLAELPDGLRQPVEAAHSRAVESMDQPLAKLAMGEIRASGYREEDEERDA